MQDFVRRLALTTPLMIKSFPSTKNNSEYTYPSLKDPSDSSKYRVDVEFEDDLSIEQVTSRICQLSNPQVIVWYIGYYGLRQMGVEFYKDFLISPVFKQNAEATFWLVDLTAWGAFKNSQCSIHNFNSYCNYIEGFLDKKIKCIKSAAIFKKMQEISDKDLINYFKKALKRNFISKASKDFPNKNIQIREIFSNRGAITADWYNHDVNKSYSIFQYFEGCLLVDEIVMEEVINKKALDIQIVFAIPNDETKYYKDKAHSFQKDILFLVSKRCASLNIKNINLHIKFLAFKYGSHPNDRPYNSSGKILKNSILSYEDVVGHAKNSKKHSQKEVTDASSII